MSNQVSQMTIGMLAAQAMVIRADQACARKAKELREVGSKLNILFPSELGHWSFLQELGYKLESQNTSRDFEQATVSRLASNRVYSVMNECLEKVVDSTETMTSEIPEGKQRWDQYKEGLITESEYLNSFVDALSRL